MNNLDRKLTVDQSGMFQNSEGRKEITTLDVLNSIIILHLRAYQHQPHSCSVGL